MFWTLHTIIFSPSAPFSLLFGKQSVAPRGISDTSKNLDSVDVFIREEPKLLDWCNESTIINKYYNSNATRKYVHICIN